MHATPDTSVDNGATFQTGRVVDQVIERLPIERHDVDAAKERLADADRQVRSFVRENPTVTVLGAVAIGFLVGRMVTR